MAVRHLIRNFNDSLVRLRQALRRTPLALWVVLTIFQMWGVLQEVQQVRQPAAVVRKGQNNAIVDEIRQRERARRTEAWRRIAANSPVAVAFIACGCMSASGLRERRRRSRGLCPDCGYDLRATPGRCPECGHESQPAAGTAA